MRRITLILVVAVMAFSSVFVAGCDEQNMTAQDKKIKMLKNDKLELANQIQELKSQLKEQKDLLAQAEKNMADVQEENANSMAKLLNLFADAEARALALSKENEELKKLAGK